MFRAQCEHAVTGSKGLIPAPQLLEGVREVVPGTGEVWLQLGSPLKVAHRALVLASEVEGFATRIQFVDRQPRRNVTAQSIAPRPPPAPAPDAPRSAGWSPPGEAVGRPAPQCA